jgi:hypothetical protein
LYIQRDRAWPNSSSPRIGAQRNHQDGDANGNPRGETRRIASIGSSQVNRNEQEDNEREDADY